MASNLDLNLLPVARYAGREYPELLSLHVSEPPRRRARGRETDRLILYLAMTGNAPLPPGQQAEALASLAKLFYATPGSVTAALRRTAEELNKSLLERNLHLSSSSRQGLGVLVQVVLRSAEHASENSVPLTLALSGPAQVFQLASAGVEHFYDVSMAERTLGQTKATPVTFFQANLQSSDTLLLAAQPAADWSVDSLAGMHGQGPESLRRRLFGQLVTEVNAVLVQARPGKGLINVPKPQQPGSAAAIAAAGPVLEQAAPAAVPSQPVSPPAPKSALPPVLPPADEPFDADEEYEPIPAPAIFLGKRAVADTSAEDNAPRSPEAAVPDGQDAIPGPIEELAGIPPAASQAVELPAAPAAASPVGEPAVPAVAAAPRRSSKSRAFGATLAAFFAAIGSRLRGLGRGIQALLARIFPEDIFAGLPSSLMAFTAVATPVVIVSVATLVYGRLGTSAQFENLMDQAQQIGQRGMEQTDIPARHADLTAALDLLTQAEMYGHTPATEGLRGELRQALDEMELALRVNYRPAIAGGLPPDVQITRIAVNEDDLFLLDAASGNVLHARLSGQGYQLDKSYICGKAANVPGLGPAIDMAAWPAGYTPEGNLLAMDSQGGVQVCKNGGAPEADHLARPASADDWGQLTGFTLDQGDAYVLDVPSKGVWIYSRSEFQSEPTFFFNEEIPGVQDVIDLAVNRDDLYLLHTDGSLTLCYYSTFQGVPTRCSKPSYQDLRPGRENQQLVPPGPFVQLQNTPPPDPSLFFLEPQTQAVYHFSLRNLAFQRQYMPSETLASGPATAFFIDNIKRRMFLAVGSQVYYAVMP